MEKKMTIETIKNKIANFFEEEVPPTISATVSSSEAKAKPTENSSRGSAAIHLAVAIIPVVAGVLYIKDRKKRSTGTVDTASAFMNMGVGNF